MGELLQSAIDAGPRRKICGTLGIAPLMLFHEIPAAASIAAFLQRSHIALQRLASCKHFRRSFEPPGNVQ